MRRRRRSAASGVARGDRPRDVPVVEVAALAEQPGVQEAEQAPELVEAVLDGRARRARCAPRARSANAACATWLSGFLIDCASSRTTASQLSRGEALALEAQQRVAREGDVGRRGRARGSRRGRGSAAARAGSARTRPPSRRARSSARRRACGREARRAPGASCRGPCRRRGARRARPRRGSAASRRRCAGSRGARARTSGRERRARAAPAKSVDQRA